jgi:hypothetical protein
VKADTRIFAHTFQPAASPNALTRISLESLRRCITYNPCVRGQITRYRHFYKTPHAFDPEEDRCL